MGGFFLGGAGPNSFWKRWATETICGVHFPTPNERQPKLVACVVSFVPKQGVRFWRKLLDPRETKNLKRGNKMALGIVKFQAVPTIRQMPILPGSQPSRSITAVLLGDGVA